MFRRFGKLLGWIVVCLAGSAGGMVVDRGAVRAEVTAADNVWRLEVTNRLTGVTCSEAGTGAVAQAITASRSGVKTLWLGGEATNGAWRIAVGVSKAGDVVTVKRIRLMGALAATREDQPFAGVTGRVQRAVCDTAAVYAACRTNDWPVAEARAAALCARPGATAEAWTLWAYALRKGGQGTAMRRAACSKALRMAVAADPLDLRPVAERVFYEDDGEGVAEICAKASGGMPSRVKRVEAFYASLGAGAERRALGISPSSPLPSVP